MYIGYNTIFTGMMPLHTHNLILFTGMMPLHTHNFILFTGMMLSIATSQPQSHPIKVTNSEGETVQILTTDGHGNLISGGICTCQIHSFNNGKILTCPL